MKHSGVLLLILLLSTQNCEARKLSSGDSVFTAMCSRSESIVNATVVTVGGRLSWGMTVEYTIRCVVKDTYKGIPKIGDTLNIRIIEYTLDLGGKFSPGTGDTTRLIEEGKTLVFFLSPLHADKSLKGTLFRPVDTLLGIQEPTENLLNYLRWNVQER